MRSFKISVVKILFVMVTMLMLGTVSTFAQVSVTLPNVVGVSNDTKTGDLTVGSLTGQNVTAFQFTLSYDKNVIEIEGVETAGTLIDGKGSSQVNADIANGKLLFAWANSEPLSGSGTLLKLKFKFKNQGTATLDFTGTFMFNGGTPAASVTNGTATTAKILVQGGTAAGVTGEQNIKIPVLVTTVAAGDNVYSYDFVATYNPAIINITGYELAGTLSQNGSASINPNNTTGTVAFAWANASALTGSGTLVYLVGNAVGAGTSTVAFTNFKFNTGTPTVSTASGQVAISAANVAPTLTFSPAGPNFTVDENSQITIQLVGADSNPGDVLTYSATGLPSGATLNSTTGLFSWTPTYTQAGTYAIVFKVQDNSGASATKNATITVNNVNRAPVFVYTMPDQTVEVHNVPVYFSFQYVATDADGDLLTYVLEAGPDGSSISTNGKFTWAPTPGQAGMSFIVIVKASDGTATITDEAKLTASSTITGVEDEYSGIPSEFKLLQNYPNPFNPTTTIRFALPSESHVTLRVFNLLGQEVAVLVNRTMGAGFHKVDFNAENLNTGIYIYKIEADNFVSVKKMMFIK